MVTGALRNNPIVLVTYKVRTWIKMVSNEPKPYNDVNI